MDAQPSCHDMQMIAISFNKKLEVFYDAEKTNWFYWPLNQPSIPIFLVSFYILFCVWIGPAIMKNRPPFRLKWTIIVYDFIMALVNFQNFIVWMYVAWLTGVELLCSPSLNRRIELVFIDFYGGETLQLLTYYTKLWELLDTIFFVLTKKNNHISFLHVFHHAMAAITTWHVLYCDLGATYWIIVLITNSFVHILMYSYYGLVAYGFKALAGRKKLLTRLQIIQFLIQMLGFFILYKSSCINDSNSIVIGTVALIVVCSLFINYYVQNFIKKKKKIQ